MSYLGYSLEGCYPSADLQSAYSTTSARVDLGAMVMKGYSTFHKATALLEPCHQNCFVSCLGHSLFWGGSYPTAKMQSMYSTAQANWTEKTFKISCVQYFYVLLFVSMCLSQTFPIYLSIYLFIYLSLFHSISLFVPIYLCFSVPFYVYLSISMTVCSYLSMSICINLFIPVFSDQSMSVSPYLSIYLSPFIYVFKSGHVFPSTSVCLYEGIWKVLRPTKKRNTFSFLFLLNIF